MKQPKALRLADECDSYIADFEDIAAELRRLHEVNQELLEALNRMVCNFNSGDMNDGEYKALQHARATILKAEKSNDN